MGLGTFGAKDEEIEAVVKAAVLTHGYRMIDTATVYENEGAIGKALKECFDQGVKREDLFITTKLWKSGYSDVEKALRTSLELLQLEYVDLYLVHWMMPQLTLGE